ncbi:hypothetical protein BKA70DRAFT_1263065 [Coprinopsis sp. MPI-PUGE-AT-0042]|nr:hypothetical protein BKA70DRAFT_1263065 [Coprinopsis sp. MPI-PUGE-AT-0042]
MASRLPPPKPKKTAAVPQQVSARLQENLHLFYEEFPTDEAGSTTLNDAIVELEGEVVERGSEKHIRIRNQFKINYEWFVTDVSAAPRHVGQEPFLMPHMQRYGPQFLIFLTIVTPGRYGRYVTARTLDGWKLLMFSLIMRFMIDPDTGDIARYSNGRRKVYDAFENVVVFLVNRFDLNRYMRLKLYYGRGEVAIMQAANLEASAGEADKRLVALTKNFTIDCQFYLTVRPSTLGYSGAQGLELARYPLVRDMTWIRKSRTGFTLLINFRNFKGHIWTAVGMSKEYRLDSVLFVHNVKHDAPTTALVMCLARKLFKGDYETITDIYNDPSFNGEFRDDVLDQPLIPAFHQGGHGYAMPLRPISAKQISEIVRSSCVAAGLPQVGSNALRRDAGNFWLTIMGFHEAQNAMNHANPQSKTLTTFYQRGVTDIESNIRLREMDRSKKIMDSSQIDFGTLALVAPFLDTVIRSARSGESLAERRKATNAAVTEATDDALVNFDTQTHKYYKQFIGCIIIRGQATKIPKSGWSGLKKLYGYLTTNANKQPKTYQVEWASDEFETRGKKIYEDCNDLQVKRNKMSKSMNKKGSRKEAKKITTQAYEGRREGGHEERMAALDKASLPLSGKEMIESMNFTPLLKAQGTINVTAAGDKGKGKEVDAAASESADAIIARMMTPTSIHFARGAARFKGVVNDDGHVMDDNLSHQLNASSNAATADALSLSHDAAAYEDLMEEIQPELQGLQKIVTPWLSDEAREARKALKDMSQTLPRPAPAGDDEDDEEDEEPPEQIVVHEEYEPNVFADVDVEDVREVWGLFLEFPLVQGRAMQSLAVTNENGKTVFACPKCPPGNKFYADCRADLDRHLSQKHSRWADELAKIPDGNGGFNCPGEGCDFSADSARKVEEHMKGRDKHQVRLGKASPCTQQATFKKLHQEHVEGTKRKANGSSTRMRVNIRDTIDDDEDADVDEDTGKNNPTTMDAEEPEEGAQVPALLQGGVVIDDYFYEDSEFNENPFEQTPTMASNHQGHEDSMPFASSSRQTLEMVPRQNDSWEEYPSQSNWFDVIDPELRTSDPGEELPGPFFQDHEDQYTFEDDLPYSHSVSGEGLPSWDSNGATGDDEISLDEANAEVNEVMDELWYEIMEGMRLD